MTIKKSTWEALSRTAKRAFKDNFHLNIRSNINIPVENVFVDGMAARTGTIPAGVVFVGMAHLQQQLQIISSGVVNVHTDDGIITLTGPCVFIGEKGEKRLVEVVEEVTWTTVLRTDASTPEQVEAECTVPTVQEGLDRGLLDSVHIDSSNTSHRFLRGRP